jgi:predicted TIM-barrel fold metal-dependent hydrolase
MHYDNIFLEMSWGPLNRVKEAVQFLGPDKLIFGTDSPFNDVGVHTRIIDVLGHPPPWGMNLSRADRDKILYKNAEHLLGIELKST